MRLLLLFLITATLSASEGKQLYSDTYLDHFNNKVELEWGDDAFLKAGGIKEKPEDSASEEEILPVLTAVIYDPIRPIAILDGVALKIGDKIRKRKVLEIGTNFVFLEKGASVLEVRLGEKRKIISKETKENRGNEEESISGKISKQIRDSVLGGVSKFLK